MTTTTDIINNDGIQVSTYDDLLEDIQNTLTQIYSVDGSQLNFDEASPDGQFTNALAEIGVITRELAQYIYNCTQPETCQGNNQDKMYQINYCTRKAGSFSLQNIDVTVSQTVTLQGLDGSYSDESATAFGVTDGNGNVWYLVDTTTFYNGTTSVPFRASTKGEIIPVLNTLTTPTEVIEGVTAVNNTVGYTSIGVESESNYDYRIRRVSSVASASGNNADYIYSNLLALDGVTSVNSYVNDTDTAVTVAGTDMPANSMWFIVNGGANEDIANVIYYGQGGATCVGSVSVPTTTVFGQTMNIAFDRPVVTPLYVKFTCVQKPNTEIGTINENAVIDSFISQISYTIGESASTSYLVEYAQNALDSNGGNMYCTEMKLTTTTPLATVTCTDSALTVTVNAWTFENTFPYSTSAGVEGTYTFKATVSNGEISWASSNYDPNDYGVTITGTPSTTSFNVVVKNTPPEWVDIVNPDFNQILTVSSSTIWINV